MKRKQKKQSGLKKQEPAYISEVRARNDGDVSLAMLTDGFRLRNNERNVAQQIALHPELSKMNGPQLSALRKSQRLEQAVDVTRPSKRVKFDTQAQEKHDDDMPSNSRHDSDSDYEPGSEPVEDGEPDSRLADKTAEQGLRRRRQAIKMISCAHLASGDNQLREAVIKRLSEFSPAETPIFDELNRLLQEQQSDGLAQALVTNDLIQIESEVRAGASNKVVLLAFLKAATRCIKVVKDQKLLTESFIPALTSLRRLPAMPAEYFDGKWYLLTACLRYYENCIDPNPPFQLYLFAHEFNAVRELVLTFMESEKADRSLKKLLVANGLDPKTVKIFMEAKYELCFSKLINLVSSLDVKSQVQLCTIVQKCDSLIDPSDASTILAQKLRRNVHLAEALKSRPGKIPLLINELNAFLDSAEGLQLKDVRKIIESECGEDWIQQIQYLVLERDSGRSQTLRDGQLWQREAEEQDLGAEYALACQQSVALQLSCSKYCHVEFQCFAAAAVLADQSSLTVVHAPTGIGKTYISALLAKILQDKGERVALITSSEWLTEQMREMMGDFQYEVEVFTMKEALSNRDKFDVAIVDEADEAVLKSGTQVDYSTKTVNGFWDLLAQRSILLSASITRDLKTTLKELHGFQPQKIIDLERVLRKNRIPAAQIDYKFEISRGEEEHLDSIQKIVGEHFPTKPIIVFVASAAMGQKVADIGRFFGVPTFDGQTEERLRSAKIAVRHNDRGMVIVSRKFGRGTDIRFKSDSLVVLTFLPDDASEARQLAGRSSRTMSTHLCQIALMDKALQEEDLRDHVNGHGKSRLRDGIRAVRVLMGMHADDKTKDDSPVIHVFERGWTVALSQMVKAIGKPKVNFYEGIYKSRVKTFEQIPQEKKGNGVGRD